jgi:hypothetical protein
MATEPLATVATPSLPKTGQIGFKEVMGVQEPYLQRKAELQTQITGAEGEEARAKQAQAETLAAGKVGAQQAFGKAEKGAMQEYQQKLEAEPLPTFIPTKDTAQDIAGLFSLIGVIGMIAGRSNAQQAMGAMNGMLEGHRKGRADLYKQQASEFDKNFKAMLSKHAEFRKEMEDAVKLATTDKEAGMQAAELAAVKSGSDIVKAQLRKGDLVGALNLVKESSQGADKALTMESQMRQKAADRAASRENVQLQITAADKRAELNRQAAKERAEISASARASAKGDKPPPKEITQQNTLRNNLIPKIESAVPVIDRLQKEGKWADLTTLMAIDPRIAEYQFRDDKEALNVILTLAYFRSKEFETAGKALTKKEDQILAPIVRGDLRVYEGIKNAMEDGLKTLKSEQKALEYSYPFLKTYNEVIRTAEGAEEGGLDMQSERGFAYEAIDAGADINEVKRRFKQKTGEDL